MTQRHLRFANKGDWDANTFSELLVQVQNHAGTGFLARKVLQPDGSRQLVVIPITGIEGHHPDNPSCWKNDESPQQNHELYPGGPLKGNTMEMGEQVWRLKKSCYHINSGSPEFQNGVQAEVGCLIACSNETQEALGSPRNEEMNGEMLLSEGPLDINSNDGIKCINEKSLINQVLLSLSLLLLMLLLLLSLMLLLLLLLLI